MGLEDWKPIRQHIGLTVTATAAVKLDVIAPVPTNARAAILTIEENPLRSRQDGVDPTAVVGGGRLHAVGEKVIYSYDLLKRIRFIADSLGAKNTILSVLYIGEGQPEP